MIEETAKRIQISHYKSAMGSESAIQQTEVRNAFR